MTDRPVFCSEQQERSRPVPISAAERVGAGGSPGWRLGSGLLWWFWRTGGCRLIADAGLQRLTTDCCGLQHHSVLGGASAVHLLMTHTSAHLHTSATELLHEGFHWKRPHIKPPFREFNTAANSLCLHDHEL